MSIPYSPQVWADDAGGGTPLSASRLTVMEQGISDAQLQPACRVYTSAPWGISAAAWTVINFDSERFDTASGLADTQHDTTVNISRLTCRYPGVYLMTVNGTFGATTQTARGLSIRVGGIQVASNLYPASLNSMALDLTTAWSLNVGDYAEAFSWQTLSGTITAEFMWVRVG